MHMHILQFNSYDAPNLKDLSQRKMMLQWLRHGPVSFEDAMMDVTQSHMLTGKPCTGKICLCHDATKEPQHQV